jgi:hypothetical protein
VRADEVDDLAHPQHRRKVELLRRGAELTARSRGARIGAEEPHGARIGFAQSGDAIDRGALSGAVGAEQHHDLTRG